MTFNSSPHTFRRNRFRSLLVIGFGDVVKHRARPAARDLRDRLGIERIVYFDASPAGFDGTSLISGFESVHVIEPGGWGIEPASRLGLLGADTLALVCTPTASHVGYAERLAPHVGRVAVEKPLCHDPDMAARLLAFEDRVFPLGHQMFKAPMLAFTDECRRGRFSGTIGHLRFTLFESKGVGRRQIDDAIFDLAWHAFECALAPVIALLEEDPALEIMSAREATYHGGPDRPQVSTAARIEARLTTAAVEIPLLIRVGKGLDVDYKALEVFAPDGQLMRSVSLDESGHHAHSQMIEELWTKEHPDMQLGLRQVVGVVNACARTTRLARYPFGDTPDWLEVGSSFAVPAGA